MENLSHHPILQNITDPSLLNHDLQHCGFDQAPYSLPPSLFLLVLLKLQASSAGITVAYKEGFVCSGP